MHARFALEPSAVSWICPLLLAMCCQVASHAEDAAGLHLEKVGTEEVYFSYHGKPLLSFGSQCDYIFYLSEDEHAFRLWADWASEHGMNHIRAYPPLCLTLLEDKKRENGGQVSDLSLPYKEAVNGGRQFDLTRFNEPWWDGFRTKCEYLESKGIVLHLIMWASFHVRPKYWKGSLFNPANNTNSCTDHLRGNPYKIHSLLDDRPELAEVQRNWFRKLIDETYDLDNVYYDLVHEIEPRYDNWEATKPWIDTMAGAIRQRWGQLNARRMLVLGMDAGKMPGMGYPDDRRVGMPPEGSAMDWIFSRPYFDVLIYGRSHFVGNAVQWRRKYKKPYIGQECFDDSGLTYTYRRPTDRVNIRKYLWKFMMAKCQQMDIYMKGGHLCPGGPPGFDLNYDPRGWNRFEKDALVLRQFWESVVDYQGLWFNGVVRRGPGSHQYVLSSPNEAIIYCSSATGAEGRKFKEQTICVSNLALESGLYDVQIVKPHVGVIERKTVSTDGPSIDMTICAFVDDIVIHLARRFD